MLTLLPIPLQVSIAWTMYRRKQHISYPVFWSYLWFESAKATLLFVFFAPRGLGYFVLYWGSDFISTIFILAVLREVFIRVLSQYSSLSAFRQRGYEMVLGFSSLAAILVPIHLRRGGFYIREIIEIQQVVSVVAVVMLLFVVAASLVLGIRWRSEVCGIAAGVGVQGIADVVVFSESLAHARYYPHLIGQIETLAYNASFVILGLYFLIPRKQSALPPIRRELTEWVDTMYDRVP